MTMVGFDVTLHTVRTPKHTEKLSESPVARFVDSVVRFHGDVRDADGLVVHDALAVGSIIDPSFVGANASGGRRASRGAHPGPDRCDRRPDSTWRSDREVTTRVAMEVDAERFLAFLLDRLSSGKG
ncbi:MAG: nucleoside hydrolase [Vicinamibacteria bacterium]